MKKKMRSILVSILFLFNAFQWNAFAEKSGDFYYSIDQDGKASVLYAGTDSVVEYPDKIMGYPVKMIGIPGYSEYQHTKPGITSVTIPDGVEEIYRSTFENYVDLVSVNIPDSVKKLGDAAFKGCLTLKSITIPASVEEFGHVGQDSFGDCINLKSAEIYCKYIRGFARCTNLSDVHLHNTESIGYCAFAFCKALKSIVLPEGLKEIGEESFVGCGLTSIIIPESVEKLDYGAFIRCNDLAEVIFCNPDAKFEEESYEEGKYVSRAPTFAGCNSLSHIYAFKNTQAQSFAAKNTMSFTPLARVTVNGERLTFDMPPIIEGGRVLVPLRKIFEALNAEVGWDDANKTVTAVSGNKNISLKIGADSMTVNGEKISLDVPAKIKNGRTLVPLRAVSSALGANVGWDEDSQTAIITN